MFKELSFGLSTTDGGVNLLDGFLESFVGGRSGTKLEFGLGKELA